MLQEVTFDFYAEENGASTVYIAVCVGEKTLMDEWSGVIATTAEEARRGRGGMPAWFDRMWTALRGGTFVFALVFASGQFVVKLQIVTESVNDIELVRKLKRNFKSEVIRLKCLDMTSCALNEEQARSSDTTGWVR